MKTEATHNFLKKFKRRFSHQPKIREKFIERTKMFAENPQNPFLQDHPLKGKKIGLRAFSVSGDIRVVYYIYNNTAYFLDIGTHNQVY